MTDRNDGEKRRKLLTCDELIERLVEGAGAHGLDVIERTDRVDPKSLVRVAALSMILKEWTGHPVERLVRLELAFRPDQQLAARPDSERAVSPFMAMFPVTAAFRVVLPYLPPGHLEEQLRHKFRYLKATLMCDEVWATHCVHTTRLGIATAGEAWVMATFDLNMIEGLFNARRMLSQVAEGLRMIGPGGRVMGGWGPTAPTSSERP